MFYNHLTSPIGDRNVGKKVLSADKHHQPPKPSIPGGLFHVPLAFSQAQKLALVLLIQDQVYAHFEFQKHSP